MKNSSYSSSSEVPSIAPSGMGAAVDALIRRRQATKKREQWEDNGHPLKKVVRKNSCLGQPLALALLTGLSQSFSTIDLGCKEKSPQVYGNGKANKQIQDSL